MNHKKFSPEQQRGMMLLEGLIAILIFSLGILAIVGLHSATVRHTTDAKYRVDASFLANQSIGLMWTDRDNLAFYETEETGEAISSLPNGKRIIAVDGNQVTVTVTWQMPGDATPRNYTVVAQING